MASLIKDDKGQWITLSGLTISLSLVIVAILINQAGVTGYYSSYAVMEFPKEQIRELKTQTHETAKSAAQLAWNNTSNVAVFSNFTMLINNYSEQVNTIYAAHGRTVNITLFNYNNDTYTYQPDNITIFKSTNHTIENIWLNISYDDGTTNYSSTPEIIQVKQ
jgi:NAD(P)H-dependent flavin oxidoreductase YrpB (nitropropane dioxygenase family)